MDGLVNESWIHEANVRTGAERCVHFFRVRRMMEWLNSEGERDDGILGCKSSD